MLGFSTLETLFKSIIATGLVTEVFHSVIIRTDNGARKPSAPIGTMFKYVGIDDTQGFNCYCRVNGPLSVQSEESVGSCSPLALTTIIPHRLVFFNDHEDRPHDDLTGALVKAVMNASRNVRLKNVIVLPDAIYPQETNGSFSFTTSTYYMAIDFSLLLKLQTDNCQTEISCQGVPNPYR